MAQVFRRSPQLSGGGHLLRPCLIPLRIQERAVLEHVVDCLFCCSAAALSRVGDANALQVGF